MEGSQFQADFEAELVSYVNKSGWLEGGLKPKVVKVDGGMVVNNWFSQFLSDLINLNVIRPKVSETTALGAALFAGYHIGEFKTLNDIKLVWKKDRVFSPKLNKSKRNNLLQGWKLAIRKTLA